ncbi:hypothetical protein [Corynebacterium pacaense]|uniref:hypothetical protein n=1 Tax=Corynebacterium pacaense TaxID=1816684 RepID=UPI0015C47641|nr:hypothetical protein [Corynebacterium pacaense]
MGLTPAAHRRVGGFSLGMKQRLGPASALLGNSKNLILDEPVNSLDPGRVHWMCGAMRSAVAEGRAVLVSSHLLSEIQIIADRLVVIGRGELIGDHSMAEFLAQGTKTILAHTDDDPHLRTALENRGAEVRISQERLVIAVNVAIPGTITVSRACWNEGILIFSLTQSTPSLEENFLQLTDSAAVFRADV